MQTKTKGSMKKQIVGTVLASAVILAAVGAAGFMNERMSAEGGDANLEISVAALNPSYSITDPHSGAIITYPNYPVEVETIRIETMRFYSCFGAAMIATCGDYDGGDGVGFVSSQDVANPDIWSTLFFDPNFNMTEEGEHRIGVIGFNEVGGVLTAVDLGRWVNIFIVNPDGPEPAAPGMIVHEVVGGTLLPGGVWELPHDSDWFDVILSYNDMQSIDSVTINGVEVPFSNCAISIEASGQLTCRIDKSEYAMDDEEGRATVVICGTGVDGTRVCVTMQAIDPDAIDVPDTGVGGGFLLMANEDAFLAVVVALLTMGLATVYILFRRASRA